MSPELTGPVPGLTSAAQAIALAGVLAEQGITTLNLLDRAGPRTLAARATDLPGVVAAVLAGGEEAVLSCDRLDLRVEVGPAGLRWRTTRPETARLFGDAP
ncbi:MAG: hypothetical protein IT436_14195 [Phycisphaerales bacterium]|nr:hypothetical protein [Phycisphaerales bacterium]